MAPEMPAPAERSLLPPVIREIVRLIGHGPAMALVHEFGGQDLRIPKTEASATWAALAEVIGEAAMKTLASVFGGEQMSVALCARALKADRNRKMVARYDALLNEGYSSRGAVSVLVREYRPISYRTVEKIVNAPLPAAEAVLQGELF